MNLRKTLAAISVGGTILAAAPFAAMAQSSNTVASAAVYVPDYSHAGQMLPDHTLDFDAVSKSVDAVEGQDFARFTFNFTNVSGGIVAVLNVHPSCGCTTAEMPPTPWLLPAGTNAYIKLNVNLAGKQGILFKSATFTTDKGRRDLSLRINLSPAPAVTLSDSQKMAGIMAAKVDRQAVFKGDCATCHIGKSQGLFGDQLFKAACAICHEAAPRATMVPDLARIKVATSPEFWRTWITYGKPGSLMPAFSNTQGGPLNDMQISSLASYLATTYPSTATNSIGN
jgi:mono/diheme cytochrome c family protein